MEKVVVSRTVWDDLDNDIPATREVHLALDGEAVRLDLCEDNYEALRTALSPLLTAGRKEATPKRRKATGRPGRRYATAAPPITPDMSAWVRKHMPDGYRKGGYILREARDAYVAEMASAVDSGS